MELVLNGRFLSQRLTGVQRVALEVVRAIDRLLDDGAFGGLTVRLAVPQGVRVEALDLRRISTAIVPGPRGQLWEQIALPRFARRAPILCLGNSAPLLSLVAGRPVGVMLHDQAYRIFRNDYSLAYRLWHHIQDALIVRRAQPIFTVSASERETLAARYPKLAARIVVTPNGGWAGDKAGSEAEDPSDHDGYGLYVGTFSERKNCWGMVAAAVALARTRGRAFLFAGPASPLAQAAESALPQDVRHLVTFGGYVADADLPALYRGAAFLLYPSFYEASGLPPMEAMTFGCPAIVSDLPVLRERCGEAALYCDPADPISVSESIYALLDDPELHATLAAEGFARARRFTWRAQAARILTAMQSSAGRVSPVACFDMAAVEEG